MNQMPKSRDCGASVRDDSPLAIREKARYLLEPQRRSESRTTAEVAADRAQPLGVRGVLHIVREHDAPERTRVLHDRREQRRVYVAVAGVGSAERGDEIARD